MTQKKGKTKMKFQNLDELYTHLRDKLVQKKEEKPRLIWRLRRVIEDDSYNNSELQSLSITIVCGSEVYENELYEVQGEGVEKELDLIEKTLEGEELPIEGFRSKIIHAIIDKQVSKGGYPHEFLLQTLKFVCEEEEEVDD